MRIIEATDTPGGWQQRSLGEVATLQRGMDFPIQARNPGNVPVYGSNGIDGYHDRTPLSGPVVITGRSGSIGSVYFEPSRYWPLNTTLYVKNFHGNEPRYVARLLDWFRLDRYVAATGVPSLNRNFVHPEQVRIPPFPEQRLIAEILDNLDETIHKTEQIIAKLQQMKQGLLHDLLTRGIDDNGELRDPERHPQQFKASPLGRIPTGWNCLAIGGLASHVGSGLTPRGGSEVYRSEGVLFLRSQNIHFDGLRLDDVAYISTALHQSMRRSEVIPFDVLLNITGASIGRVCFVPDGLGPANINQHVCSIRIRGQGEPDARFLAAVLGSHIGQRQIYRLNAGSNREGLNYEQLRAFVIPWPMRLERQTAAKILHEYDNRLAKEQATLAKFRNVRDGLMDDLLTGRVRVKVPEEAAA